MSELHFFTGPGRLSLKELVAHFLICRQTMLSEHNHARHDVFEDSTSCSNCIVLRSFCTIRNLLKMSSSVFGGQTVSTVSSFPTPPPRFGRWNPAEVFLAGDFQGSMRPAPCPSEWLPESAPGEKKISIHERSITPFCSRIIICGNIFRWSRHLFFKPSATSICRHCSVHPSVSFAPVAPCDLWRIAQQLERYLLLVVHTQYMVIFVAKSRGCQTKILAVDTE
ncbi:hypothetical protein L209DRAFT_364780 [Thermothelomyces heterothallicus CBS 203.75]